MKDLSIIIPSKNEKWLQRTTTRIYDTIEMDTEVLIGEDQGMGQRALINELVKKSTAKYIMKVDAHCLFSKGFDKVLIKDMDDKTIMSPYLLVLDEKMWQPQHKPTSSNYCFDTNLVFQYNKENKELINETMCLQGSAWIVNRETYWKWNLCDETLGSWGHMGVELGIKAWLNGGVCKTNKKCHYAHLFRHIDKEFPYERDKKEIRRISENFKKRFKNKSIKGLIEKYDYPADWNKNEVDSLT